MSKVYGTPVALIPLGIAAAAASMTRAQLEAALGPGKVIKVSAQKSGVTPADLEAVSPGASSGLEVIEAPAFDVRAHDSYEW